jgi:hypothetical protein
MPCRAWCHSAFSLVRKQMDFHIGGHKLKVAPCQHFQPLLDADFLRPPRDVFTMFLGGSHLRQRLWLPIGKGE